MKRFLWAIAFGVTLIAFTAYCALDTFVLREGYESAAGRENTAMFATEPAEEATDATEPETEASRHSRKSSGEETADPTEADADNGVSVTLTEYTEYNTEIYVAEVTLPSAQYLRTAFAEDTYGKNITAKTSEVAAQNNALLAINGDFYGARESGYVIRNGVIYRDTPNGSQVLCLSADGTFRIVSDSDYTAAELLESGVWQAWSFGPALVQNGAVTVSEGEEVGRAMASNPRTALGILAPNRFVFVVSDGRTGESEGLSLHELAEFMQSLGVTEAYNLDGGGSSTMYYNGEVVNNPTTNGSRIKERSVSDIVYVG